MVLILLLILCKKNSYFDEGWFFTDTIKVGRLPGMINEFIYKAA